MKIRDGQILIDNWYYRIIMAIVIVLLINGCSKQKKQVDAYGNFEAEQIIISSSSSGIVVNTFALEGHTIEVGELLFEIDTTALVLQKKQILSGIKTANSRKLGIYATIEIYEQQISNLNINIERFKHLLKDEAATQKQLDDLTGKRKIIDKQIEAQSVQLKVIDQEIESLKSQVNIIQHKINECRIYSPVNGTILETYINKGELAVPGKAIAKIADLSYLILKAYVSGAQLSEIEMGQTVEVFIDSNNKTLKKLSGKIIKIADEAEFTPKVIQTREERVKLVYAFEVRVKNEGQLKIGMPAEIMF